MPSDRHKKRGSTIAPKVAITLSEDSGLFGCIKKRGRKSSFRPALKNVQKSGQFSICIPDPVPDQPPTLVRRKIGQPRRGFSRRKPILRNRSHLFTFRFWPATEPIRPKGTVLNLTELHLFPTAARTPDALRPDCFQRPQHVHCSSFG